MTTKGKQEIAMLSRNLWSEVHYWDPGDWLIEKEREIDDR